MLADGNHDLAEGIMLLHAECEVRAENGGDLLRGRALGVMPKRVIRLDQARLQVG